MPPRENSRQDTQPAVGKASSSTLSACLSAYVASVDTDDLATALKYWTVLLDDYQNVGDALGGDNVVTHDTGYAMRTFAPFSALAYDWLRDAPGVTEELRARARTRFDAWSTYYRLPRRSQSARGNGRRFERSPAGRARDQRQCC